LLRLWDCLTPDASSGHVGVFRDRTSVRQYSWVLVDQSFAKLRSHAEYWKMRLWSRSVLPVWLHTFGRVQGQKMYEKTDNSLKLFDASHEDVAERSPRTRSVGYMTKSLNKDSGSTRLRKLELGYFAQEAEYGDGKD